MILCRPFFKKIIFRWHAAGLPGWLETSHSAFLRNVTYSLMKNADLSIVLPEFNRRDAGVSDPCPQFEQNILKQRRERIAARRNHQGKNVAWPNADRTIVHVLYLALCTREKGVFDTVEGVALANDRLSTENSPLRFKLTLIGAFTSSAEGNELQELKQRQPRDQQRKEQSLIRKPLPAFPKFGLKFTKNADR